MLRIARAGNANGSGAGSSTATSFNRPANSDTPRNCSDRPNSVPMFPRSCTRASMKRVRFVRRRVVPERRPARSLLRSRRRQTSPATWDPRTATRAARRPRSRRSRSHNGRSASPNTRSNAPRHRRAAQPPHLVGDDIRREPATNRSSLDLHEVARLEIAPRTYAGEVGRVQHELAERAVMHDECRPLHFVEMGDCRANADRVPEGALVLRQRADVLDVGDDVERRRGFLARGGPRWTHDRQESEQRDDRVQLLQHRSRILTPSYWPRPAPGPSSFVLLTVPDPPLRLEWRPSKQPTSAKLECHTQSIATFSRFGSSLSLPCSEVRAWPPERCSAPLPPSRSSRTSRQPPASASATTAARSGKKYLPETIGAGAAFLDADNDGWQDIFLVNSTNWPGPAGAPSLPGALPEQHDGTFTDVTKQAGLGGRCTASGSRPPTYDNDGDVDIYVTGLGPNHLFRNAGNGRVHRRDGARRRRRSGLLHQRRLVRLRQGRQARSVRRQLRAVVAGRRTSCCSLDGKTKSYCTPESYKGQSPTLYHNKGDGTFEDVTQKAGLYDPTSKALGVALSTTTATAGSICSSPTTRSRTGCIGTSGNGTFADAAVTAGVAFNEAGVAARRHGRGRRRLRRLRPPEPRHRQLLERDDRALHQRGQRACSSTRRRPRRSGRRRC